MNQVFPYSPQAALESKARTIPDEIVEAVNDLLASRYVEGGSVTIKQKEIVELAKRR